MPEYQECPFCDRIFEVPLMAKVGEKTSIDRHIEKEHHKVKVRRGSNYRWLDAAEVERRLGEKAQKVKT